MSFSKLKELYFWAKEGAYGEYCYINFLFILLSVSILCAELTSVFFLLTLILVSVESVYKSRKIQQLEEQLEEKSDNED